MEEGQVFLFLLSDVRVEFLLETDSGYPMDGFGFWFVMPSHGSRINYIRHAYKWCAVIR